MRISVCKIWPWLLGVLLLLWLYIAYYSSTGYHEILIPSGETSFTASFSRVSEIIPINEDVSHYALVEDNPVSITIQLMDVEDGGMVRVDIVDSMIHTNGYANKDNIHADGLPLNLEPGHSYTVQYWAACNGQALDNLSIALYGERVSYRWLQLMVLVTVLIGAVGLYGALRAGKAMVPAMLLLWISVYVLYLYSMPLQLRDEEESAFARAYAVSNEMMGREAEDANGYVYVDDVGLRNSGYLVYDIPFYRFWSNIGAEPDASVAATVTYRDDGMRTLRTYVDAASITAARTLGVSYPLVYLAAAIARGVAGTVVLGVILFRCKRSSTRVRVMTVALLPSVISVIQMHCGVIGLLRPLESKQLWLRMDEILHRIILYLVPSDRTAYLITFVPLLIIGVFAYHDLHHQATSERAERMALSAMVVAVVVNALLRLKM